MRAPAAAPARRGRKPIGDRAMTAAERKRRQLERDRERQAGQFLVRRYSNPVGTMAAISMARHLIACEAARRKKIADERKRRQRERERQADQLANGDVFVPAAAPPGR